MSISRIAKAVLLVLLVIAALPASAQDEPAQMTMWIRSTSFVAQTLVDEWNANNESQIELTVIPPAEYVTKMGASIAAGEPPDIASIDLIYTPAFSSAGQLVDITEHVRALDYADDLTPAHMELGMYEGRNYAVPFGADVSFIIYNIDLFEQAGLDADNPPSTWAEMLEAMRAIDALGDDIYGYWFSLGCAGCNAFTYLPFIWASGGDVLSDDYSEATITTDPIVREALEFYNTIWEEGLVPEGASIDSGSNFFNAFAGGNIGMAGLGNFALSLLQNNYPDLNWGVFHIPGKDGGTASFTGGDVIAIPSGTEHADEAWRFIEWALTEGPQIEIYAANGHIPVRLALVDNEYFEDDPRLRLAASAPSVGHTPYTVVYNDLFNDPNGPWLEMLQVAILDGDIDGALELGQERFTQIMEG